MIIYLGLLLLTSSGELLLTDKNYEIPFSFVLAPNKDLAVSSLYYYRRTPTEVGVQHFSVLHVTVRTSHLTVDGR